MFKALHYLFLLLVLCSTNVSAQQPLLQRHSKIGTCADPKKNHIATRKVYEFSVDSNFQWITHDTVIEFYNRNGRLDSIRVQHPATSPYYEDWSHFHYDKKGRIISDSTNLNGYWEITKYEYKGRQEIIHHTRSEFEDLYPTAIINYNKDKTVASRYNLNKYGDTIYFFIADDTSSYERNCYYVHDSTQVYCDNTTSIRRSNMIWTHTTHLPGDQYEWSTSNIQYLDATGKVTLNLSFRDSTLEDSAVYYYENNRLSCIMTRADREWHVFTNYETFKYNQAGQLTETRYWNEDHVQSPEIRTYSYNEKGLLTRLSVKYYGDHTEMFRYEYTYY